MSLNKKGALTADKTVVLILAIIAILGVIGLIVSLNPNFTLKLLPDFSPSQDLDEEIPVTGFDACGQIGLQTVARSYSATNSMQDTNLYLTNGHNDIHYDKTSERWSLKLNRVEVGYLSNEKAYIIPEFLDENNFLFIKNLFSDNPFSVTVEDLALLDGSTWLQGGYICKDDLTKISEYKKAWPIGTDVELIDLSSATKINDKKRVIFSFFSTPTSLDYDEEYRFEKKGNFIQINLHRKSIWFKDCNDLMRIDKNGRIYVVEQPAQKDVIKIFGDSCKGISSKLKNDFKSLHLINKEDNLLKKEFGDNAKIETIFLGEEMLTSSLGGSFSKKYYLTNLVTDFSKF